MPGTYISPAETGLYYLNNRYYNSVQCRFINLDDVSLLGANSDFTSLNLFVYCGNNPIYRIDNNGYFWNTIIGAVAGAIVGGITAAITGADIAAGAVSGAISGAISGAALDITIATGGVGIVAFAAVTTVSGFGGAAGSYINQRMSGKEHDEVNWKSVAISGVWGAIGGAISFGVADIGGATCQTLKQTLSHSLKEIFKQAGSDLATTSAITFGTWLNDAGMNTMLN